MSDGIPEKIVKKQADIAKNNYPENLWRILESQNSIRNLRYTMVSILDGFQLIKIIKRNDYT